MLVSAVLPCAAWAILAEECVCDYKANCGPGCGGGFSTEPEKLQPAGQMYFAPNERRIYHTHVEHMTYMEAEYTFGVVADLDLQSRDPQEFLWRSYLKKGRVVRLNPRHLPDKFTLVWDEELELNSSTATRNRSMELSELVNYNYNLIAFCDFSGIAYKIDARTGKTFQRWAIADGDGDEPKPFKSEWACIKEGVIYLGSIGFEWYGKDGALQHRNPEWIKTIDSSGLVRNLNWHPVYQAIRTKTNTTLPGYLWHEAVEWEPHQRLWIMLPRFASTERKYVPGAESQACANLLIIADEGFTDIRVRLLDHHDQRYGFTSVRRLPGSHSRFMVLRVWEQGRQQRTQAAIIDLEGNFYSDPPYIEVGERKFEGLAFW